MEKYVQKWIHVWHTASVHNTKKWFYIIELINILGEESFLFWWVSTSYRCCIFHSRIFSALESAPTVDMAVYYAATWPGSDGLRKHVAGYLEFEKQTTDAEY